MSNYFCAFFQPECIWHNHFVANLIPFKKKQLPFIFEMCANRFRVLLISARVQDILSERLWEHQTLCKMKARYEFLSFFTFWALL